MKRSLFLFFVTGFLSLSVKAQDLDLAKLRPDIIPHSPEAEAMTKYAVLPVNLYTGLPQISVPVYTIKTPSLTLPFSLGYNYNGCRPNETSSWVGLGWSLQGGGVITRTVKGYIDEAMSSGRHYDDYAAMSMLTWKQAFLQDVVLGNNDSQPDLYTFNVGGHSGKFIMIKNKAYIYPYQNLKITPYSTGFKLIDETGNEYDFTDYETTYMKNTGGAVYLPYHKSAWFVSKIISADKRDTVTFGYTSYSFKQPDVHMDSYTIDQHLNDGTNTSGHTYTSIAYEGDHIDSKLLTSVTSNYGSIYFTASADNRKDMTGSTGAKYLDSIRVIGTGSSSLYKVFKLVHGYFGDSSRLKLSGVVLRDYNTAHTQVLDSSKYGFEYENETEGFPTTGGTKAIDLWGYYNGASNSMLFPSGSFSPSLYSYADRSPHYSYTKMGILKKMTYPTGGYSTFEYEPNQSGHYNISSTYTDSTPSTGAIYYNPLYQINGYCWGNKTFSIRKPQMVYITYHNLQEGGSDTFHILHLYNTSNYYQPIYTSPLLSSGVYDVTDSIFLQPGDYDFYVQCNQSLWATDGSVEYKYYSVDNTLDVAPGLRVDRICFFDGKNAGDTAQIKKYQYNEGVDQSLNSVTGSNIWNTCSSFNITTFQSGNAAPLSDLSDEEFYYQEASEINRDISQTGKTTYTYDAQTDFMADIKPTSETEYKYINYDYQPVKKVTYQYATLDKNSFVSFKVRKTQQIGPVCDGCWACSFISSPDETQPTTGLNEVYGTDDIQTFTSKFSREVQRKEIEYNDNGDSSFQVVTYSYYDDSDHVMPTRVVSKDSRGFTTTTTYKYPLDYTFDGCGTLTSLNNNFVADIDTAKNQISDCHSNLEVALLPYQPYSPNSSGNQTTFSGLVSSYNCQNKFKDSSTAVFARRDTAWNDYEGCLASGISSGYPSWQKAILWMKENNIITPVIEKYVTIKKADSSEYLLAATRNQYSIVNSQGIELDTIKQVETDGSLLQSSFLSTPDSYYKTQVTFSYDNKLNLQSQQKVNDVPLVYFWDYDSKYPVAQVTTSDLIFTAYTSFEADGMGNWQYTGTPVTDTTAPTGTKCYYLSGSNTLEMGNDLANSGDYIVSYWSKNGQYTVTGTTSVRQGPTVNGWTYYEHSTHGKWAVFSGTGYIDEVRLYPKGSQMISYTYDPLVGITSQCDINNRITYYEYDGLNRLSIIRDQDKKIIKKISYQFVTSYNQ